MSLGSWFKNAFHHVNPHNLAGALAAAQTTIDTVGAVEKWDWLPQFDQASTTAIAALSNWKPGDPASAGITGALQAAVSILQGVQGLSDKDKLIVSVFVAAAESALAFCS